VDDIIEGYIMETENKKVKYFPSHIVPLSHDISDGRQSILTEDFIYIDRLGIEHRARKGLNTNGMSGWRIVLALIGCSPYGAGLGACVIHDQEWSDAAKLLTREDRLKARKKADKNFVEMLKVLGIGRIRRRIIYRAVRMASPFRK